MRYVLSRFPLPQLHHNLSSLLCQGTSIRRTNETDMNAQSSRSHAIFSLTMTQKKYTGSGPPPRSFSPLPPLAVLHLDWLDLALFIPLRVSILPPSAVPQPPAFILPWAGAVVSDLLVLWEVVLVLPRVGNMTTRSENGSLRFPSFTLLTLLDQNR